MNKSTLQEVNDWAVLDFDEFKKSPSPSLKTPENKEMSPPEKEENKSF